jgi:hypothetical protein
VWANARSRRVSIHLIEGSVSMRQQRLDASQFLVHATPQKAPAPLVCMFPCFQTSVELQ